MFQRLVILKFTNLQVLELLLFLHLCATNPVASNTVVSYLGGGGGGGGSGTNSSHSGGDGGAGGFRALSKQSNNTILPVEVH